MRVTVFYDDDCGFCRRMLRLVLHIDNHRGRGLAPKALQDADAATDLAPLSFDERMASWHLLMPDRKVHSGGAALLELARLWQLPEPLIRALEANAGLVDRAYDWVAANRGILGRLTRWMPDLPIRVKENPPA